MKIKTLTVLVLCLLMATVAMAAEYEIVAVADGGSLSGKITTKAAASSTPIETTKDQQVCHATVPDESVVVGEGGGLANCIVYFVDVASGKDPASMPAPELANVGCRYRPHVQSMMVGEQLTIKNEDPILHNTHTYDDGDKTVFNLALPIQGQTIKKRMKKPGLVHAKCDAGHTWMDGYVWVNQNPYYAVTDANGAFEITDVPEGDYTVVVWHEKFGATEHEVEIVGGDATTLSPSIGK
jgi:plastocyanin